MEIGLESKAMESQHPPISATARRPALPYWQIVVLTGIAALGLLLRLHDLDGKSLTMDESFSVYWASKPLLEIPGGLAQHEFHPPLYYLILHFWMKLGRDEVTLRLLSVALEMAALPPYFVLTRRLLGPGIALLSAFFWALSPRLLWDAQDVRSYALVLLIAVVLLYFLVRVIDENSAAMWTGYALTSVIALYAHYGTFPLVASADLAALIFAGRKGFRRLVVARAGATLLFLPWIIAFVTRTRLGGPDYVEAPSLQATKAIFIEFSSALFWNWSDSQARLVLLSFVPVALLGCLFLRNRRRTLGTLLILLLGSIAVAYLIGVSVSPNFYHGQRLVYATIPYFMLLSAGILGLGQARQWTNGIPAFARLPGFRVPPAAFGFLFPVIAIALLTLLTLLNVASVRRYFDYVAKEEWHKTAAYVTQEAQDGDLVFFAPAGAQIPFDYYLQRYGRNLQAMGLPVNYWEAEGYVEPPILESDLHRLRSLAEGRSSFWLVLRGNDETDFTQLTGYLSDNYTLTTRKQFVYISVLKYSSKGFQAQR